MFNVQRAIFQLYSGREKNIKRHGTRNKERWRPLVSGLKREVAFGECGLIREVTSGKGDNLVEFY